MRKLFFAAVLLISMASRAVADEGMWLPLLLGKQVYDDMVKKGLKLTKEQLYQINKPSLKDAIIIFGGGCTGEIVSSKGLIFTNHHCGYDAIASASSVEKNYLRDGFYAKTTTEEIQTSLSVQFLLRIDDVTKEVMDSLQGLTGTERLQKQAAVLAVINKRLSNAAESIETRVSSLFKGNQFLAFVYQRYSDIRLVGTPPESVGKFGGDTDNWVWPRHTGDFSVFRIYAGKDNKPAAYSPDNVPYTPLHYLPISFQNRQEGDFTMVYGFPGQTEQHVVSSYLKFIIEKERPARIHMRDLSLAVIDEGMKNSDLTRIQYSAKQASIANAWKKWIGQIEGLKNLQAVQLKLEEEKAYKDMALSKPEWKKYAEVVNQLNTLVEKDQQIEFKYAMGAEYFSYGPEYFKLVRGMEDLVTNYTKYAENGELAKVIEKMKTSAEGFFKNYNSDVDLHIFMDQTKAYLDYNEQWKEITKDVKYSVANEWFVNYVNGIATDIYSHSIFTNQERYMAFLSSFSDKSIKKLNKDLGYTHFYQYFQSFRNETVPAYRSFQTSVNNLMQVYVEGKYTMFPDKKHWPDANSTLRITYGQLEGSAPTDGMRYTEHTTLDGIIAKYNTGNPDFDLLPRMVELHAAKNYGPYAQGDELWVCFTGSNHTTGGNSGSPVLDKNGYLMGLNFDRSWESTMSDYLFDPNRCRNIVVDIRYVLWVMDIYSDAKHLVDEMTLMKE